MKLYFMAAVAGLAAFTMFACDKANDRMDRRMGDAPLTSQGFINEAGAANIAEVELGRIALERGQSAAVKEFARQMVDDHTKANKQLSDLASAKSLTLPSGVPSEKRSLLDAMRKKSGDDFDRAYAEQMVKDHNKALGLFQDASKQATVDQDLRNFAQKTLPTLEHHKNQAESLENNVRQSKG